MIKRQLRRMTLLTALVVAADGCTEPDVRRPFAIDVVSGGRQQGEVGTRLPVDIAVQVTDSFGRSVPHATVTFEITTATTPGFTTGSVEPMTVETDGSGVARTRWTLGTAAREQTIRAWAGSTPGSTTPNVSVRATAQAGAASTLASASDRTVAITVGDSARVAVVAKDRYGNLTSIASFTWHVIDPAVASVTRTELSPDRAAMVVANAGGTTVLEARSTAAGVVSFDLRTYVGPGRDIAYELNEIIYLLSADGTTTTGLGPGRGPAWSPDGRQIAFSVGEQNLGPSAIYVMNADGSGRRKLTDEATLRGARQPTWSPDGRKIAFITPFLDPTDPPGQTPAVIFVMNADGSAPGRVLRTLSLCSIQCPGPSYPAWSPDGTRIAYSIQTNRSSGSHGDVFVVNADGSGDRSLTSTGDVEHETAWSPDGRRIVFESSRFGAPMSPADLYVINADGTSRSRLTSTSSAGSSDVSPTWSPDGRIAFVRGRGAPVNVFTESELFVVNSDGTELRRVLRIPGHVRRPAWRPGP